MTKVHHPVVPCGHEHGADYRELLRQFQSYAPVGKLCTVNMIERRIKGGQKTIAYKQLGLSMDIETKVVQHVSSPKESNLTT